MSRSRYIFFILLVFLCLRPATAQNTIDIRIRKIDPAKRKFTYLDKPISPLALIALYPIDETGRGQDSTDLRLASFSKAVKKDTLPDNEWKSPYQKDRTYIVDLIYNKLTKRYLPTTRKEEEAGAKVFYTHIGNTSGGKFVVSAMLVTEMMVKLMEALMKAEAGNWDFASMPGLGSRVFILDVRENSLIRLADFEQDFKNMDQPVIIRNDTIFNGTITYPIPLSCR